MKKLYNKGLMYQFFYVSKWAILLGTLFFSLVAYSVNNGLFIYFSNTISDFNGNIFLKPNILILILLCGIIFLAFIVTTGINKRVTATFLASGPYTKKEIKKNQIIYLFTVFLLLIIDYIYISMCVLFKNRALMPLIEGYWSSFFYTLVVLILVGLIFIGYLLFMDMLFSNTFVLIGLIIATPILIVNLLFTTLRLLSLYFKEVRVTFVDSVFNTLSSFLDFMTLSRYTEIYAKDYIISIGISVLIILIVYALTWIINSKITINMMNKFVAFPLVEKVTISFITFNILFGRFSQIAFGIYYKSQHGISSALSITEKCLILGLGTIVVSLITFIAQKLIRKVINKLIL